MNSIRRIAIVTLFLLSIVTINGQVGKEFWFVAPDVVSSHGDVPIGLRLTARGTNATVTISQPANPAFTPIVVNVPAYTQVTVKSDDPLYSAIFSKANIENAPINKVNNKGLLITSTQDISAYYEVLNNLNPDIFTLKGENALGTDFYIPGQNAFPNRTLSAPQPREQINIIATEDGTTVTIVPKVDIVGGSANTPLTVTLNKGQSYSINANDWETPAITLAGTHVTSDKKIAITISDDSIEQLPNNASNAYDLIGDQIIPTNIIGSEYIAIKASSLSNAINKIFVSSTDKPTTVTVDGNPSFVLNPGEVKALDFASGSTAMYIKTDNPVYAYQVSGLPNGNRENEMGSALLPTISGCTGSKRVSFTRNFALSYYVQIMTKNTSLGNFKMYNNSGVEVPALSSALNGLSWKQVGSTPWYTVTVDMSLPPFSISTSSSYSIENSAGLFHLSVLDQNGGSMSYGYYSSYNSVKIEGASQSCVGDHIELRSKYTTGKYFWKSDLTGDTILSTTNVLNVTRTGQYYLTLDENIGCTATDTLDVIFNMPVFTLSDPGKVCPEEDVIFSLPPQYTYLWSTGSTSNSITVKPIRGGTVNISVVGTDSTGCASSKAVAVVAFNNPIADIPYSTKSICIGDTIKNTSTLASYQWYYNGTPIANSNQPYIVPTASGTYTLSGKSIEGCVSRDSATITVNPLPVVTIPDQTVCYGSSGTFTAPAGAGYSYAWSNGSTLGSNTVNTPSTIWVQVKNSNGCINRDTASLSWFPQTSVSLSYTTATTPITIAQNDIYTCAENPVTLSVPAGYTNYRWNIAGVITQGPAMTTKSITASPGSNTIVAVQIFDSNGCSASDTVTIHGYPTPTIALSKAEYCVNEVMSIITPLNSYEWSFGGIVVGSGNNYTPTAAGNYTVRGWNANSCVTASVTIPVNGLPTPSITGSPVCEGTPYIFTGLPAAGVSYLWSQDNTAIDGSKSYTSQLFSVTNPNLTWLEVTDTKGCKAKTSALPSWNIKPTVDISYFNSLLGSPISGDTIDVCPTTSLTLTGTATALGGGPLTYRWFINNVLQAGTTNTQTVTIPGSGESVIRLEITDGNGCTNSDQVRLMVQSDPALLLAGPNEICLGQPLSIESIRTSISSFSWSFGGAPVIPNQYTFTPSAGGDYTVSISTPKGCNASKTYTVNDPAITLTTTDIVTTCANSSQVYSVVAKPNYNYLWSDNSTGTSFTASTPGIYSVTATHNTLGCKATRSMELEWLPARLLDLGDTLSVCSTTTWPFPVSVIPDPNLSNYRWIYNSATVSTTNSYSIPSTGAGLYTVLADYTSGGITCPLSQDFTFNILTVLNPLSMDPTHTCGTNDLCLCEGEKINLKANNGFNSYQWYTVVGGVDIIMPGETNQNLTVSATGDYKLIAAQPNGCNAEGVINVTVTANPKVTLSAPSAICQGASFVIQNTDPTAPNYDYEWVLNDTLAFSSDNNFAMTFNQGGTYTVTAKVKGDRCTTESSFTVNSPTPPIFPLYDQAICSNSTYDLTSQFNPASVAGLTSSSWSIGGAAVPNPTSVNTTGKYDLAISVTDLGISCDYSNYMNLKVVTIPQFPANMDKTICNGDTALLVAGGNYLNYQWSFHGNSPANPANPTFIFPNTPQINASNAGYYEVTAWLQDDALVCSNTASSILLTVNSSPSISIASSAAYLCQGGFVTLTASNSSALPTSYVWNTGSNINPITVNNSGFYETEGTDSNGCSARANTTVIDYTKTPVSLPIFTPICQGQSVTLPAIPGVTSYQWYYNTVGNTDQAFPNQPWTVSKAGKYVLSYLNEPNGCWVDTSLTLTVLPLPTMSLTAPSSALCDGQMVTLNSGATTPNSFIWTKLASGGTADSIVSTLSTYSPTVSGYYRVLVTAPNGCSVKDSANITFNPNPIVSLGSDLISCVNENVTLSIQNPIGLSGFEWKPSIYNNGTSSITTNKPGLYTVKAFNSFGCSTVDSITVSNYPQFNVQLAGIAPICDNATTTLISPYSAPTQVQSYQWFYNNLGNSIKGAINSPWTVNSQGTYVLGVTDLNGCQASGSTYLQVMPSPIVDLGPDREMCDYDSLVVQPKQSYVRYMWNNNPTDNLHYKHIQLGLTDYSVEVEDKNGCISTGSVKITPNPLPSPSLGNDITVCEGTYSMLIPFGGNWSAVNWSTGAKTNTLTVGAGNYTVEVTDNHGCKEKDDITVNWLLNPRPYLGADSSICQNVQLTLDAGSGYQSYRWHNTATTQTIIANLVDTVNKVTVIDNNGCVGWDTKLVYLKSSPDYSIGSDTALCSNYTLWLDAGSVYTDVIWSTGETINPIEVDSTASYSVIANDGCVFVYDTIHVTFLEAPTIVAIDTMIYAQITIMAAGGTSPYKYSLNDGALQDNNTFTHLNNDTYKTYVEDINKCWAVDTILINSVLDIDIPPFFTPNADGHNDRWVIGGLQERFPNADIIIFDRYGRLVAQIKGSSEGWDGQYLGKDIPSDDYWFVINLNHINKTIKGNLTIKR